MPAPHRHRIAIIGFGKIAQDQHAPAIAAHPAFELVGVSSRQAPASLSGGLVRVFPTPEALLAGLPDLDAVAICTPPGVRHAIAQQALRAGRHVLLEKPPAATLAELADLERLAREAGRVLFATWHARYGAGVEPARAALAGQAVRRLRVDWKEDVRRWHPGQAWVWQPGGFGVFDPGINALSILTRILPEPLFVRRADLSYPAGRDAPIAASLQLACGRDGEDLRAEFDWRQTGPQTWDIEVETAGGTRLRLQQGGSRLEVDGRVPVDGPSAEYPSIYARFDALLRAQRSDVDESPLRLVADAFMLGRRLEVEPFAG